ncbi:hypothetical protein G7046_g1238 [Stylonectria norvegica]|nr:hypothetical protein G7046_g1238 [Stylonectria norvegica]
MDNLLQKGIRVRAVVRSKAKAERLLSSRKKYSRQLTFYYIDDLTTQGVFDEAVDGIDGVIHIASPLNYNVADKEKELVIPAIQGVQSILDASLGSSVKRVVMTSSFGAVLDMERAESTPYTYSPSDWNPITYSEAISPDATPQDAYRGSKVFAEQGAWDFMKKNTPQFDLVTLCPSMVFGPVAGPLHSPQDLNESNSILWRVATGGTSQQLPPARFNFWIDVRDLAEIHIQALFSQNAGGKRFLPVAPEKFNYEIASKIMAEEFPTLGVDGRIVSGTQKIKDHVNADTAMNGSFPDMKYRTFRETVKDLIGQILPLEAS